jgi:DNA-binding response OmpR family regulator
LHATLRSPDPYLARALEQAGHVVEAAADLADLALAGADGSYDAVLIEAAAADEVPVRRIADAVGAAVLVLVVDGASATDHARLLRAGADACFVRPVRFMELEARLLALARLGPGPGAGPQAPLADPVGHSTHLAELGVSLSKREYALLDYLLGHAGEMVAVEQILEHVWGEGGDHGPERVRTAVGRLRGKLASSADDLSIVTVRGHGYRLEGKMKLSSSR